MKKVVNVALSHFLLPLALLLVTPVQASEQQIAQKNSKQSTLTSQAFIATLALEQGKGTFTQEKYFSFLTQPIVSTGSFTVHQGAALWQGEKPVFSQLLLTPNAIFRRLNLTDNYQKIAQNSEITTVLTTIFTGNISESNWHVDDNTHIQDNQQCLIIKPKIDALKQLFQQMSLCLPLDGADLQQRWIYLTEAKGNKTQIHMSITATSLSSQEQAALVP